jgi:cytoplasmic iron level regulating protein YaaA (DUF328/UPF0246 family)
MLLVISPSETHALNGRTISDWTMPPLMQRAEELAAILRGMDEKTLAELMHISPRLAARTYHCFQTMTFPFTTKNVTTHRFVTM